MSKALSPQLILIGFCEFSFTGFLFLLSTTESRILYTGNNLTDAICCNSLPAFVIFPLH